VILQGLPAERTNERRERRERRMEGTDRRQEGIGEAFLPRTEGREGGREGGKQKEGGKKRTHRESLPSLLVSLYSLSLS